MFAIIALWLASVLHTDSTKIHVGKDGYPPCVWVLDSRQLTSLFEQDQWPRILVCEFSHFIWKHFIHSNSPSGVQKEKQSHEHFLEKDMMHPAFPLRSTFHILSPFFPHFLHSWSRSAHIDTCNLGGKQYFTYFCGRFGKLLHRNINLLSFHLIFFKYQASFHETKYQGNACVFCTNITQTSCGEHSNYCTPSTSAQ